MDDTRMRDYIAEALALARLLDDTSTRDYIAEALALARRQAKIDQQQAIRRAAQANVRRTLKDLRRRGWPGRWARDLLMTQKGWE